MTQQNLNFLKPKKFLSLGYHKLQYVGDLSKDFFVTIGCSFAKGTALDYQNTWSSKIAQLLNLEHINLSFEGSSLEYQFNVIKKVQKFLPQHKFILWMHTFPIRSHQTNLSRIIGDKYARIQVNNLWTDVQSWNKIQKYVNLVNTQKVLMTNCWHYNNKIKLLLKEKICKHNPQYFYNKHEPIDQATDNEHPGSLSHNKLASDWFLHITKHFSHWITNK